MKTPSPPVFEINLQRTLILTLLIFFELTVGGCDNEAKSNIVFYSGAQYCINIALQVVMHHRW